MHHLLMKTSKWMEDCRSGMSIGNKFQIESHKKSSTTNQSLSFLVEKRERIKIRVFQMKCWHNLETAKILMVNSNQTKNGSYLKTVDRTINAWLDGQSRFLSSDVSLSLLHSLPQLCVASLLERRERKTTEHPWTPEFSWYIFCFCLKHSTS